MKKAAGEGMIDFDRRPRTGAIVLGALCLCVAQAPARAAAPAIEVFHYLDTRADAQRVAVLRDAVKSTGYAWRDFTVAEGFTGRSESLLRFRVESRNAPSAAIMKTPIMRYWAGSGKLLPLDDIAAAQRWDALLPKAIADTVKVDGRYVAVPLTVHRVNWLWINEEILRKSGAAAPTDWTDFFVTAEAMKRAGYAAVAYYGRPTQNLLLFEMIALGIGGPDFHRKALVEYDAALLRGPVMEQVLRTYRRVKGYTEPSSHARISIDRGSSKFQTGKVGMHLMGDWANPAFYWPEQGAPFRYQCVAAPGTGASFLFTSDSIAMFRRPGASDAKGQRAFAGALMSALVQHGYSLRKGSIPARQGVALDGFESCAVKTAAAFRTAVQASALLPAISMTASREVEDGMQEVVTEFWNDDRMPVREAMERLVGVTRRR